MIYLKPCAEGTFTFHTVKHYHSFRIMDCTSNLLSVCLSDSNIAKNFNSARTITESIVTGVLAPVSIEELLIEYCREEFVIFTTFLNSKKCRNWPVFG